MGKALRVRKNYGSCLLLVETEAAAECEKSGGCGVHLNWLGMGLLNKIGIHIDTATYCREASAFEMLPTLLDIH